MNKHIILLLLFHSIFYASANQDESVNSQLLTDRLNNLIAHISEDIRGVIKELEESNNDDKWVIISYKRMQRIDGNIKEIKKELTFQSDRNNRNTNR